MKRSKTSTSLGMSEKLVWWRKSFCKVPGPQKYQDRDFPRGAAVKNPPANAGDTGSSPGQGRSHMAAEQLSRCATTTEPALWSLGATTTEPTCHSCWGPRARSPCSATGEATAVRGPRTAARSGPRSPQLERACAQQRRPNAAKNK